MKCKRNPHTLFEETVMCIYIFIYADIKKNEKSLNGV